MSLVWLHLTCLKFFRSCEVSVSYGRPTVTFKQDSKNVTTAGPKCIALSQLSGHFKQAHCVMLPWLKCVSRWWPHYRFSDILYNRMPIVCSIAPQTEGNWGMGPSHPMLCPFSFLKTWIKCNGMFCRVTFYLTWHISHHNLYNVVWKHVKMYWMN